MSMHPRLPDGSFILLRSLQCGLYQSGLDNPAKELKVGSVVKCRHIRYGYIIKTIVMLDQEGRYWLEGEHKSSITMKQIGPVLLDQIVAQVIFSVSS
jgi:hypothetical protein